MKVRINDFEIELEQLPNGKFKKPDLAKKYEGYKYSISPLKQTNETIMVFQKPYKTGSCLHDTLAYESGDDTCCCGALDIDGNRVGYIANDDRRITKEYVWKSKANKFGEATQTEDRQGWNLDGRYPSQTFCDSNTAEVLDKQSGISKPKLGRTGKIGGMNGATFNKETVGFSPDYIGNWPEDKGGGCSKILHKCDFEENEHDLYFYNPKVSKSERNAGCDGEEKQYSHDGRHKETENPYQRNKSVAINNHPTLKPIKLNERILKLFKTPNEQKIIYPFAGSGSEIIGGIKAGFTNWVGCEINPDYVEIAKARIDYWSNKFDDGLDEIVVEKKIDESQVSLFDLMEGETNE